MQILEISTRRAGRHAVVGLRGELDLAGAADLRSRLRAACAEARGRVALEMSELSFIDSTGLSVLVEYHEKARAAGGRLLLVAPHPGVVKVLGVTGLDRHLRVCDRLEDVEDQEDREEPERRERREDQDRGVR
ncbi:MAG TPA: STAS domain-containing protein [Streptosporangiaceae bacterium]